jgi:hypothetical protein
MLNEIHGQSIFFHIVFLPCFLGLTLACYQLIFGYLLNKIYWQDFCFIWRLIGMLMLVPTFIGSLVATLMFLVSLLGLIIELFI